LTLCGALATAAGVHDAHRRDAEQVLAPGYGPLGFTAPEPGSYSLPPLGGAADGSLVDCDGERVRLSDLYGDRMVVLSFIYTACSDANGCPLASYVLSQLQQRLSREPGLREQVRLISISFDPRNDTPAVMCEYRERFARPGIEWRFLTADSEERLEPLLEAFGQSLTREYDAEGNPTGNFSHILRVYLIDRAARIRNIYSVSFLHADTLSNDIRTLLLAGSPRSEPPSSLQGPGADRQDYAEADYTTRSRSLAGRDGRPVDLLQIANAPPLGLPPLQVPTDNPLSDARVRLGRKLFFDRRLSLNGTISCAMCHVPEQGFTVNEMATAVGIEGRSVRRNAPTLYNSAYLTRLFHDGRETRLEQQIWGPLLAANEMGNPSVGLVLERIRALPDYAGLFEAAFDGRGPGMETLGMAFAAYQRTLLSANSAFDRWYYGGQEDALGAAAQAGFRLFTGKAGCSACHRIEEEYALFTDNALHNTGIGYRASFAEPASVVIPVAPGESLEITPPRPAGRNDLGRYEITLDPADRWKYRTPSLRNVALTGPYMHDGSIASLREVVEFYNAGGIANENLDPLIRPLSLSDAEIDDLVAFLRALTGDNVDLIVADALAAPVGDP
jgi:cytochrome c peroxidase